MNKQKLEQAAKEWYKANLSLFKKKFPDYQFNEEADEVDVFGLTHFAQSVTNKLPSDEEIHELSMEFLESKGINIMWYFEDERLLAKDLLSAYHKWLRTKSNCTDEWVRVEEIKNIVFGKGTASERMAELKEYLANKPNTEQ